MIFFCNLAVENYSTVMLSASVSRLSAQVCRVDEYTTNNSSNFDPHLPSLALFEVFVTFTFYFQKYAQEAIKAYRELHTEHF